MRKDGALEKLQQANSSPLMLSGYVWSGCQGIALVLWVLSDSCACVRHAR